MFSNLWLNDALRRSLNPTLPQIENTDGDPLEFITVHFPLISKAKLPAIRTALDDLPSLWKESDGFWNWIEAKAPPRKAAKRRSTAVQTFGATMDDGAIVLGTIELGTKTVTLSVNSEARAARGRAMLEPVLAGLARAPLVERQSIEQMMASSREQLRVDDGAIGAFERAAPSFISISSRETFMAANALPLCPFSVKSPFFIGPHRSRYAASVRPPGSQADKAAPARARVRQIVTEVLDRREVDGDSAHALLQLGRPNTRSTIRGIAYPRSVRSNFSNTRRRRWTIAPSGCTSRHCQTKFYTACSRTRVG